MKLIWDKMWSSVSGSLYSAILFLYDLHIISKSGLKTKVNPQVLPVTQSGKAAYLQYAILQHAGIKLGYNKGRSLSVHADEYISMLKMWMNRYLRINYYVSSTKCIF